MKAFIIINPLSGCGTALEKYYECYDSIVKKYHIEEFIISNEESRDELKNYVLQNIDKINKKDLIIGIGGDGTIFEIINHMKKYKINVPLAEIPAGTGNGYFKSITYNMNLEPSLKNASMIINNYNIKNVNLMEISNDNYMKYSRLSISWGIISNIDINTECMRFLGSLRFDIGGVYNVLSLPSYSGRLEYNNDNKKNIINGNFCFLWTGIVSHPSMDIMAFPNLKFNSNKIALVYVLDNVSRFEMTNILLSLNDGSYVKHPKVIYNFVDSFKLNIDDGLLVIDGEKIDEKEINVISKENQLKILS